MGLFGLFFKTGIDAGIEEFQNTPGAFLIDVRTKEEYAEGHIGGSENLPLDALDGISAKIQNLDTPLFVHCRSGARSGQAAQLLKRMGYRNVKNIGGILEYHGRVER